MWCRHLLDHLPRVILVEGEDVCEDICEDCGSKEDVYWQPSLTRYYWDGWGENPNRPMKLCNSCAEEYKSYWKEMWSEYYANCM